MDTTPSRKKKESNALNPQGNVMRDITILFEGWRGRGVAELHCSEVSPTLRFCSLVPPIKKGWRQGRRSENDESKAMRSGLLRTQ
jgi:hypothetical protein